jgi:hypothetical protein
MPTIKISDLHPTGSELFHDSESYMNELGDGELDIINGGFSPISISVRVSRASIAASKAASEAVKRSVGRATPYTPQFDPGQSPRTPASFTFF